MTSNLSLGLLPPVRRAFGVTTRLPVSVVIRVVLVALVFGMQLVVGVQLVGAVILSVLASLRHKQPPL